MKATPDLIDLILSVVINHQGISTTEVGMMVGVDPLTALDALTTLYDKAEIERKTDHDGTVRWYDPEQPRRSDAAYRIVGQIRHPVNPPG